MRRTHYIRIKVSEQPACWVLVPAAPSKPKSRVRTARSSPPPSLQQFIKSQGGLDPGYNRGQWAGELAIILDAGKQGVIPGLLNSKAGKTMEELAEACQEAGYIADPDVDALLFALGKDIEACLTKRANERVYGHTGEDHATRLAYEQWSASIPEEGERAA